MSYGGNWLERRNEELKRMFGPKTDTGGGGFYILLFPLYGPILAVLMYPLATAVMLAAGITIDRFRTSVGIGDLPVPWWQWLAMIGVFIVFFRIDNQLGLRKNFAPRTTGPSSSTRASSA
jgi:hypothetical protein